MDPVQLWESIDPMVTYALVATGVGLGLLGIIILIVAANVRARLAGALLFPFLPSVVLFAIFPTTSVAAVDYIGKLGGPIAAYLIFVIWTTRNVIKDDRDEQKLKAYDAHLKEQALQRPLEAGIGAVYSLPGQPDQRLIVLTGDIRQLVGTRRIDVIVNSENDYLMLGRPYDRNVSGMLRYLDAKQDEGRLMLEDSLQINLQERIAGQRLPVNIGAVFETPTSGLADRGVSFIFHVATVRTTPGGGYSTNASQVPICVANCFEMFDKVVARGAPLESILFPLIGAGDGSLTPREAANAILPAIVSQMAQHPAVKVTYVLAYRGINKQVLVDAAAALNLKSAAPAVEREPAPTAVRTAR